MGTAGIRQTKMYLNEGPCLVFGPSGAKSDHQCLEHPEEADSRAAMRVTHGSAVAAADEAPDVSAHQCRLLRIPG